MWLNVKILMNVKLEIQVYCSVSLTQTTDILLVFVLVAIRALYFQCYSTTVGFFNLQSLLLFYFYEFHLLALNKEIFACCF